MINMNEEERFNILIEFGLDKKKAQNLSTYYFVDFLEKNPDKYLEELETFEKDFTDDDYDLYYELGEDIPDEEFVFNALENPNIRKSSWDKKIKIIHNIEDDNRRVCIIFDNSNSQKYILGLYKNKIYIISLPKKIGIFSLGMHDSIVTFVEKRLKIKLSNVKGGMIDKKGKFYGKSEYYGAADHETNSRLVG